MPSKRFFSIFPLVLMIALILASPAQAAAGGLDCSFGNFGTTTFVPSGYSYSQAAGVAQYTQAGKLVAAGMIGSYPNMDGFVARLTVTGALDTTFNGTGISQIVNSGYNDYLSGVAAQDDGKVVVIGYANAPSHNLLVVARYNIDGTLDTSFDGDGWTTPWIGSGDNNWYDVLVDSSGNIYVGGNSQASGEWVSTLVKLSSTGGLLNTWTYNLSTGGNEEIRRLAWAGSEIYAAGSYYNSGTAKNENAILAIKADGSLDSAFNSNGKKLFSFSGAGDEYLYGIGVDGDGKILVTGDVDSDASASFYWDLSIARLKTDGSFDTTFSTDGKDVIRVGTDTQSHPRDLVVQSNKKPVIGAWVNVAGSGYRYTVIRYNTDGTPDTSFGSGGLAYVTFDAAAGDTLVGMLAQPDDKLVLAGTTSAGKLGLARLLPNDSSMSFGAARISQPSGDMTTAFVGKADQNILLVELCMNGASSPLDLTGMTFNTTGSTYASDIIGARAYSTPSTAFAITTRYGSDVSSPSGAFTVSGSQALGSGINYFWLAYNLGPMANGGGTHVLDAGLDSLTFSGATGTVSVVPSTATGSRSIIYDPDNTYEWITNVTLGAIDNDSGQDPGAWGDYTALTTTLQASKSYNLTVTAEFTGGEYLSAFFDWNGDGDFTDSDEAFPMWEDTLVADLYSDTKTISISVPAGAKIGATHFMIAVDWTVAPNGIYNQSAYGEAELYGLTVEAVPTAVNLAYYRSLPRATGLQLEWASIQETDTLGFIVYRSQAGGDYVRITPEVISAQTPGELKGNAYTYVDAAAQTGVAYTYKLVHVAVDGSTENYGLVDGEYYQVRLPLMMR
jgi:uncharacterized delta-60 repeat protein